MRYKIILMTFFSLFSIYPLHVSAQEARAVVQPGGAPLLTVQIPGFAPLPVNEILFQQFLIGSIALFILFAILGIIFLALGVFRRFRIVPRDSALVFGWNAVKNNLLAVVGIMVLYVFFLNIFNIILSGTERLYPAFLKGLQSALTFSLPFGKVDSYSLLTIAIGFLFSTYAAAGIIAIALGYMREKRFLIPLFFVSPARFGQFLLGNIVYTIGIVVGGILFLFPAVWFGSKFFFWPYILLDKNTSFIGAYRESAHMTRGARFEIFLFWFLSQALLIFGLLFVGIGYIITFPLVILATTYLYKNMGKNIQTPSQKH